MSCYNCAERDKCMLRIRPELCEIFCCPDAEAEEKQAEEYYREEMNRIAEQYGD